MEEVIFCHKGNGRLASRLKESFGVECRAPSRRLQRIMTDFGADEPFVRAAEKIREHYGVEVSASSVRNVTLAPAREFARQEQEALDEQYPRLPEGVDRVILQSDGAMVPVVEIEAGRGDARRRRSVCWKEAKSSLACEPGSLTPVLRGHDERQGSRRLADAKPRHRGGHGAKNKSACPRRRSLMD